MGKWATNPIVVLPPEQTSTAQPPPNTQTIDLNMEPSLQSRGDKRPLLFLCKAMMYMLCFDFHWKSKFVKIAQMLREKLGDNNL